MKIPSKSNFGRLRVQIQRHLYVTVKHLCSDSCVLKAIATSQAGACLEVFKWGDGHTLQIRGHIWKKVDKSYLNVKQR